MEILHTCHWLSIQGFIGKALSKNHSSCSDTTHQYKTHKLSQQASDPKPQANPAPCLNHTLVQSQHRCSLPQKERSLEGQPRHPCWHQTMVQNNQSQVVSPQDQQHTLRRHVSAGQEPFDEAKEAVPVQCPLCSFTPWVLSTTPTKWFPPRSGLVAPPRLRPGATSGPAPGPGPGSTPPVHHVPRPFSVLLATRFKLNTNLKQRFPATPRPP